MAHRSSIFRLLLYCFAVSSVVLDTRGASANCFLKGVGGAVACQILVWAECTSSLKIMANKVLEIVQ